VQKRVRGHFIVFFLFSFSPAYRETSLVNLTQLYHSQKRGKVEATFPKPMGGANGKRQNEHDFSPPPPFVFSLAEDKFEDPVRNLF
jgi:hypothetical protein